MSLSWYTMPDFRLKALPSLTQPSPIRTLPVTEPTPIKPPAPAPVQPPVLQKKPPPENTNIDSGSRHIIYPGTISKVKDPSWGGLTPAPTNQLVGRPARNVQEAMEEAAARERTRVELRDAGLSKARGDELINERTLRYALMAAGGFILVSGIFIAAR